MDVLPTERDVKFFEDEGYWVAPKILDDARLDALRDHMMRVYEGDYETGKEPFQGYWRPGGNAQALRKTDNSHWSDLTLRGLATDPTIGAIAAKLMRAEQIRLWHDQLLYKPGQGEATESVNVGWHQDYFYWQAASAPTLLTAWVAFDDVDEANGCMRVIPGSHKWGLIDINDFFAQDLAEQESRMQAPDGNPVTSVPLIMKAGQMSFHHALTLHGSGPNTTEKPRRSLAVHLMTGETRYREGTPGEGHMNVALLGGKEGDLFVGDAFPALYEERAGQPA